MFDQEQKDGEEQQKHNITLSMGLRMYCCSNRHNVLLQRKKQLQYV